MKKRLLIFASLLVTAMSSFALTIEVGKVYTIASSTDNTYFVKDNGGTLAAAKDNDGNALWVFENAGGGHYYVKNYATGRYAQECSTTTGDVVTLGDTPVEYSVIACNEEGTDCFGLTSTNQAVTDFTDGCIGWNWDNARVQTWDAKSGTNHKSFWKLTEEGTAHDHNYVNGFCQVAECPCLNQTPLQDNDAFHLVGNAGQVEWISAQVSAGNLAIKVKLTADIDFEKKVNLHSPIGPNTGQKFNGIFDGQGHRIMNMIINRPDDENIGFFGFLRGNAEHTKIMNLIMDKSCSITAKNRAGGFAGSSQNNGSSITIENCINEASVTVSGQDAAGFVGGVDGGNPKWIIRNCVNAGTITSTHADGYVGALFCYQNNGDNLVENFINLGTINGHRGGNMGRVWGTIRNMVDLSNTNMEGTTDGQNRGLDSGLTSEAIASGALAYYMNKVAGSTAFYQTIGEDAYPVPFSTSAVVYEHASYRCDATPLGTVTYDNNAATPDIPAHQFSAQGVCPVCNGFEAAELVDGKFLLKNAGNIEWMGVKIANGEQYEGSKNYNQATYEMQNDIDFAGVTHTPIGPNAQRKFNGVFDGKGHKISNMKVEAANAGMFCWLRGGTTIKNLTLDETCSFHGTDRAGSFACVTQVRSGGDVNLENCVNYASVTTDTKIASGLIAACNWENDDEPTVNIINCVNAGNVTCTGGDNTVAFFGWSKSAGGTKINIINSYNTGTLNKVDGDNRNLVRASNMSNVTITNSYDLTTAGNQGEKTWNTGAPLTSGELCAVLGCAFGQELGVDDRPLPSNINNVLGIGATGYATFVAPYDIDNLPVAAYAVQVNGDYAHLEKVNAVPEGNAVVLKAEAGYYNYNKAAAEVSPIDNNDLKASDGNVKGSDGDIYALANKTNGVGFYKVGEAVTIPAGKAYLQVSAGIKEFYGFWDDDATGIEAAPAATENATIYNLAGQKMSKAQKGINIINGKKVLK